MADVNKSVEISYRADLKQLINQLQKMPGITEQEAKKMVGQLDRQFKKAERSAKKAAAAQSRAMRRVQESAKDAADKVQDLGDQAGDLDRAFMGAGTAANLFSPALGEVVMLGSDAAAIFEAVTLGLNALNPMFIKLAAGLGLAVGAFGILNMAQEKRLDILDRLAEAEEENRNRLSEIAQIVTNVSNRYDDANSALAVFTGQLSQLDADKAKAQRDIVAATQADVDAVSERIRQSERVLKILMRIKQGNFSVTKSEKELVKAAQARFDTVSNTENLITMFSLTNAKARTALATALQIEISKEEKIRQGIKVTGEETVRAELERLELQNEYNQAQSEEDIRTTRILENKEKINELDSLIAAALESGLDAVEAAELPYTKQIEALREQEHLIKGNAAKQIEFNKSIKILENKRAEAAAKAMLTESLEAETNHNAEMARLEKEQKFDQAFNSIVLQGVDAQIHKLESKHNRELDNLTKLAQETGNYHDLLIAQQVIRDEIEQKSHDLRIKHIMDETKIGINAAIKLNNAISQLLGQRASNLEQQTADEIAQAQESTEQQIAELDRLVQAKEISELEAAARKEQIKANEAAAITRIENSTSDEIEKLRQQEFVMNQLSSIANIGFSTAEAIMKALATFPGPPGIILASAAGAAGAVQLGTVLSQKPPTSHMGGFLQPDEQLRTVLSGEAVLDRATVNRIGGEQGVRELMSGSSTQNEVVIIQPFRHIDRYNKSARKQKGRKPIRRY
tara:strand:+ start:14479 stop:16707 length:2229 start_codon:yes stop_codon:yes gene_type:complete